MPNHPDVKKYGRGEIFGLENVFHRGDHFTSAITVNKSNLHRIPMDLFKSYAEKYI